MNNEIKFLPPFKRMCMTIGTLPSSFYASMSYYESMVWLYEYLKNEVIPVVNNNSEVAEELQTAFTQLEEYIRTYFDNLDIQHEVDVKLDEMAEDGTLADMIAEYIKMQGQLVYDSVASMKAAENVQNGSFLKTYGYHEYNDGGGALYKARTVTNEDTINDMTLFALHDPTLVAELIYDKEISVLQLGAYGDDTHDDSTVIQYAINLNYPIMFPEKTYLIGTTINIINKGNDNKNYLFNAEYAKFHYSGESYCFNLQNVQNAIFNIGYIDSTNGGNITMSSSGDTDFIQYLVFNFKVMKAKTGYANVYADTTEDGWVNEITWNNGRFYGTSSYNFHLKYGVNNWNFNNIGFEGGTIGVYLQNENAEHSMGHYTFNECRHQESITTYIKAEGWVKDVYIYYPWQLNFYNIIVNSLCNNWYVYSSDNIGSHLINGNWYFSKYIKTLEGGINVGSDTDFNDLIIPGDYNFNQTTSILSALHKPTTRTVGKLTVQTFNNYRYTASPYILQTYLTVDGIEFSRTYDGTNWSTWDLVNQCSQMLIPENTDLDDLKDGSFFCNGGTLRATLSNVPSSADSVFRLDIKRLGTKFTGATCQQILTDGANNIYSRVFNSTWTAWKKIAYV